ncbi:unnamed protein product [Penicillium palitans]
MEPPEQAPLCEYSSPPNSIAFNIQPTTPEDHPQYLISPQSPYSTQDSTKTCLHTALEISRMFESLPIPQPLDSQQQRIHPRRPLPRTMPSFACCLMQSSYVLFMIFYKAPVVKQLFPQSGDEHTGALTDTLMEELRQGLQQIIATVSNYSLAFEALDGMRGFILNIKKPVQSAIS